MATSFRGAAGAGLLDDLFESGCVPEDDLFLGVGVGFQAPPENAAFGKGFEAAGGKSLEEQRASSASTQCPSSAHLGLSSFEAGPSLADLGLGAHAFDDIFGDLPTSSLVRRAKTLARAAAAPSPTMVQPPVENDSQVPPPIIPAGGEDNGLPSAGAAFHAAGACTPCKFFRGRRGCKDGPSCGLCHHPHEELTYSGIRRLMRKKAEDTRAPAPPAAWRPPPGLPEPPCGAVAWGMSVAYMGHCR